MFVRIILVLLSIKCIRIPSAAAVVFIVFVVVAKKKKSSKKLAW